MGKGGFESSFFIDGCQSSTRASEENGRDRQHLGIPRKEQWVGLGSHGDSYDGRIKRGLFSILFKLCFTKRRHCASCRFPTLFSPEFPRLYCPPDGNSLRSACPFVAWPAPLVTLISSASPGVTDLLGSLSSQTAPARAELQPHRNL